jgi:hypothetical protein
MTTSIQTLRPGIMVALSTSIGGNVTYRKEDIGQGYDEGVLTQRWETTKTTLDLVEYERAKKVRSKVTSLLRSVCVTSKFTLLCPLSREAELMSIIKAAREAANLFNATASTTSVEVYIMLGKVASDDAEAVRGINSEVRKLLEQMTEGARALDPVAIRKAANSARELSAMLTDDASSKVKDAIAAARQVARDIAKSAERAELVVDELALAKIGNTRLAFLDLDTETVDSVDVKPQAAALELEPLEDTLLRSSLEAAGIEGGAASAACRAPRLDLTGEA